MDQQEIFDDRDFFLDLKDFFLCGTSSHIAQHVSELFENKVLKDLLFRALYFLLDNQYVVTGTLPYTYKCAKGSGIGLRISAIVASCYFYAVAESVVLSRAQGLIKWLRPRRCASALHFQSAHEAKHCRLEAGR